MNERRKLDGWAVAVFVLSLVVRLAYLWESSASPGFSLPIIDAFRYDAQARQLADGVPLGRAAAWQPLFYPAFLGLVYALTASSLVWAKVIQAVIGAVTSVCAYALARRATGRAGGTVAGVVCALDAPLVFFSVEPLSTVFDGLWGIGLVLLLVRARERFTPMRGLLLGLCSALAVHTRPTFLPFVLVGWVWLLGTSSREVGFGMLVRRLVPGLTAFVLVMGAATWAVHRATGTTVILPTSGGINLYIGNHPDPCETLAIRPGWRWNRLTRLPLEHGAPNTWGPEASSAFTEAALALAHRDPAKVAKGILRKAVELVSAREIPRNEDMYLFRRWSWVLGALLWKAGTFGFPFGLLFPLSAAGLVLGWRRLPAPLRIFLAVYALGVVAVFVSSRYRVPLLPPLAVTAAVGISELGRRIRARRGLVLAGLVIAAAALLANVPGPFCEETYDYEGEYYRILGSVAAFQRRDVPAESFFKRAIALDPGNAEAHGDYARFLRDRGRPSEALGEAERAVALQPGNTEARATLATLLSTGGRPAEAIAQMRVAVGMDPFDPSLWHDLGILLSDAGDRRGAITALERSVQTMTDYAQGWNDLGIEHARAGSLDRAIAHFAEAARLDPTYADARFNLGLALLRSGRAREGVSELEAARRLRPNDEAIRSALEGARRATR